MPRRTQIYNKFPWNGGLNSAVDPGVIPDNDLVIADNVVFGTSGSRLRREGFSYLDDLSSIPSVTFRSSSGTTRTLVFASSLITAGPDNQRLVVGEKIKVTTTATAGNALQYATTSALIITITTTTNPSDTITYTFAGATSLTEGSTVSSTLSVDRATKVLDINDYWRSDVSFNKVQRLVAATDQPKFFMYDSDGRRSQLTNAGGALTGPETSIVSEVINDRLIFAFSAIGDTPKKYRPESSASVQDLAGSPPDFSVLRVHQSRLWTNEKTNKDRLHYSSPGNPEEWQGVGDSGALDIDPGDGDSEGITAIYPSFKNSLFVAKGLRLYEIIGDSPENYTILPVTKGLGAVSHKSAVAVDLDDVTFVSQKGVHSLSATAAHGDFQGSFLSAKIQPTFNNFPGTSLKNTVSVYVHSLNSIAYTSTSANSTIGNDNIYLYNILFKEWYRWPDVSCQTLATMLNSAKNRKMIIGTNNGRIISTQNGTFTDFGSSGTMYRIKTGSLYPSNDPVGIKMFKKLTFLFRPKGDFQFTVNVKIDNYSTQSLSFAQTAGGDILGSTFILGVSMLGSSNTLAPFTQQIDGIGRGLTLEITQNTAGEEVELYGFMIEYEPADINQEVV